MLLPLLMNLGMFGDPEGAGSSKKRRYYYEDEEESPEKPVVLKAKKKKSRVVVTPLVEFLAPSFDMQKAIPDFDEDDIEVILLTMH